MSVDDGATWQSLVDCAESLDQPFCRKEFGPRNPLDWDEIEIDTGEFAEQTGRLRFEYDTSDECCGFEQGWFIDDLNIGCS